MCQRWPTGSRRSRAALMKSGVKRRTQRWMVTWSTSMPRSAKSSSTSRYERWKRRYQRTATEITSGGKQKPRKATGRGRGVVIRPLSGTHSIRAPTDATDPSDWVEYQGVQVSVVYGPLGIGAPGGPSPALHETGHRRGESPRQRSSGV
jgi:hypothetical protein